MFRIARSAIICLIVTCCLASPSFALRIVTYNTATSGDNNSPSLPRERMRTVLEGIGNEEVLGVARPIDVLILQEQDRLTTTTQTIVDTLNEIYGDGVYERGRRTPRTNGGGRGAIVYNTQTVELLEEATFGTLSIRAQSRETTRYLLRPAGYGDDAIFAVYGNHYKAGATATDRARRDVEATALRRNADTLATSQEISHMIFAGDFNIQRCTEAMYQTLVSPGPAQAVDPVNLDNSNCSWHDNTALRQLHTQSPADAGADGFLAKGGLDDRFDFQLVTAAMLDDEGLSLIAGSYRAFGNNGTHGINQPVNDIQNTAASRSILNALARTSDHLPVVVDYQIPAWMAVDVSPVPERVMLGANVTLNVEVTNTAPVASRLEADELDFEAQFDLLGNDTQTVTSQVNATSTESFEFSLPTNEIRTRVFRLRVESDSEAVVDGEFQGSGAYSVVAPSEPSWSPTETSTTTSVDFGIVGLDDEATRALSLFNRQQPANGAAMEVQFQDLVSEGPFSLRGETQLVPGGDNAELTLELTASALGEVESMLSFITSDDPTIFGAHETVMSILATATIAIPGDANLDGMVSFDDFLVVSQNFSSTATGWMSGDFDRDGLIGFGDFLVLSRNFGREATLANVPEASCGLVSITLGAIGIMLRVRSGRNREFASTRKKPRLEKASVARTSEHACFGHLQLQCVLANAG